MKLRIWTLLLFAVWVGMGACQKKPRPQVVPESPPPAPAPAPTRFQEGEKYFESGNYVEAARAYDEYLLGNPSAENQDRALFRLALSHAVSGPPLYNLERSLTLLKRLVALFPQSPLKPQAEFILGLYAEVEKLQSTLTERDNAIRERDEQLRILRDSIVSLQLEVEKLKSSVKEKDDRIREREERLKLLREEFETLKKIDMQRRPSRPPD